MNGRHNIEVKEFAKRRDHLVRQGGVQLKNNRKEPKTQTDKADVYKGQQRTYIHIHHWQKHREVQKGFA